MRPRGLVALVGPTASGKSDLAVALARTFGGVVINADSMQVYRELAILTARPTLPNRASVPHRLYGILPVSEPCSAARWCALAQTEIDAALDAGALPILVGGTGLYLKALLDGLAPVPDVPPTVRQAVRERLARLGVEGMWRDLARRDPAIAATLQPADRQRILRAFEVVEATGRPLSVWQELPREGAWPGRVLTLLLDPRRDWLYRRCDARFARMLAHGARDEAAAILGLDLDPGLPAMKTLGLRDLMDHLRGTIGLLAAKARAQQATRNYAKRQTTWFRHQLPQAIQCTATSRTQLEPRMRSAIGDFLQELTVSD